MQAISTFCENSLPLYTGLQSETCLISSSFKCSLNEIFLLEAPLSISLFKDYLMCHLVQIDWVITSSTEKSAMVAVF